MVCPKCDKVNKCDCKSCNADGNATDLIIILEDEGLYQCCFCGNKFDEQESLDYEWDSMIQEFAKKATPEMCLDWISLEDKLRKKLETEIGIGEFGFEQAFRVHFGISWKKCNRETFKKLKRDLTIGKIIN